jgi:hypothetical protein
VDADEVDADEVDVEHAPLTTASPPPPPGVPPSRAWVGGGILQAPLQRVGEFSCEYGQQLIANFYEGAATDTTRRAHRSWRSAQQNRNAGLIS